MAKKKPKHTQASVVHKRFENLDDLLDQCEAYERLVALTRRVDNSYPRWQKSLFGASLGCLLIAIALAATYAKWDLISLEAGALIFLLLSQLFALLAAVGFFPLIYGALNGPLKVFIRSIRAPIIGEADFVNRLAGAYDQEALIFVRERLSAHTESMRRRVHIALGPVEKVGLFPGFLATAIAMYDFANKVENDTSGASHPYITWISIIIVAFLLSGLICSVIMGRSQMLLSCIDLALKQPETPSLQKRQE